MRADLTLALDLEGTLITNAVSQLPRPGLHELLEWCRAAFDRVVFFTAVSPDKVRQILGNLVSQGEAPAWVLDLEVLNPVPFTVPWGPEPVTKKDLRVLGNPARVLLVDDHEGYVVHEQRDRWVPVAEFTGDPQDRELARVREELEWRIHVAADPAAILAEFGPERYGRWQQMSRAAIEGRTSDDPWPVIREEMDAIREQVAVGKALKAYADRTLDLGRAADMAGMSLPAFVRLYRERRGWRQYLSLWTKETTPGGTVPVSEDIYGEPCVLLRDIPARAREAFGDHLRGSSAPMARPGDGHACYVHDYVSWLHREGEAFLPEAGLREEGGRDKED